ncbi:MAG: hypothetical protein Q4D51_06610 [Eubacteriales bacterium]|nr:hypothetical protein [Eubacteriales bacterium]
MKKKICMLAMVTAFCLAGCSNATTSTSGLGEAVENQTVKEQDVDMTEDTSQSKEETSSETEDTQEATSEDITEESVENAPSTVDFQLELMAENMETWKIPETACYAVTDFDYDGNLELVAATPMAGTGLYTYADFYEVDDTISQLNKWEYEDEQEGASHADLVVSDATVYYDQNENVYYYIFKDLLRMGAAESYEATIAWSVKDNCVREETIGYVNTSADGHGNEEKEFFNREDATITEAEYNDLSQSLYGALDKESLKCEWVMLEPDDLDGMSKDDIKNLLTQSFNSFLLK